MTRINKKVLILLFGIILIIFLTGCDNNSNNEEIKNKVSKELDFLDTKILNIFIKLNNINLNNYILTEKEIKMEEDNSSNTKENEQINSKSEQKESNSQNNENNTNSEQKNSLIVTQMEKQSILRSNENNPDWEDIKAQIEILNESWGIIVLDLTNINIENKDILGFSSTLNDTLLGVKNENKIETLTNISKLYSYIPKFEEQINSINKTRSVKKVKSEIINAYSFIEQEKWNEGELKIIEAEDLFRDLINDMKFIKNKEYKANKTYILLKELKNTMLYKDKKVFLVKYKSLLESINTM